MIRLREDIKTISAQLAGASVSARGNEYIFDKFYLDVERDPPVADGFIMHPRLRASVWRWEEKITNGKSQKIRARYGFFANELEFLTKSNDGQP